MKDFVNRDKLRGAMAEKSITQEELAHQLGICRTSLSQRMNEKKQFSELEIANLADIFGKDVFYLG